MAKLTLLLLTVLAVVVAAASYRRVCYHTNWSQYRNGPAKFYPENIDPSLCTHIIYAFAKMAGNHLAAFEWNDESTPWMKGMYERFAANKQQNPSVKLMLAVGGWNMASAPFTSMVASATSRQEFATTAVAFLRKHNFDGLDLDWEYPALRGARAGDRHRFTQLVQVLHDEFMREAVPAGKQRLLLSAAVAAGKDKIDVAYEVPQISSLLDMINLMSYDLHGSWESFTGHQSPLYARSNEVGNQTYLNVDWAAQYWVKMGAPKSKLNIGMCLYGRSFKLPYGHTDEKIGCAASGAGAAGQYTSEAGMMAYYEVCQKLNAGGTRYYEPEQKVPYMVDGELWVGYDDTDSLRTKVDYVMQEQFGGIMVWALDMDDFSGSCGQGKYPLMRAINDELNSNTAAVVTTNPPMTTTKPHVVTTQAPPVWTTTQAPAPTTQAPAQTTTPSYRRVCYHTNWSQYRNGPAKFYPENIDPSLCTHIIYAFAKMAGNHLAAFEWNDESTPWMKGMYERFAAIKQQNPSVKLMLAVGGWNMASAPFTSMVASATSRQEFATTAVAFLRKHNFDGLDLDWEYPALRGAPAGDRHRFTQLVQVLHDEFMREAVPAGKQRLLLSAAVAAGKDKIDVAYEVPQISSLLDMINLMSYDLHGSWESFTGHQSPLYARSNEVGNQTYLNVDWAAQYWVKMGAPKSKLNIGMCLYGRSFKLPYGHTDEKIGCAASGAGAAGQYTSEAGMMAYYEVCQKLNAGGTRYYEPEQKVPYMVDGELWVGYDDTDSLRTKVDYVMQEQFGGIMVWALDMDDFSGSCGQGKYPLMRAINDELNSNTAAVVTTNPPMTTTPQPITTTKPQVVTTQAPPVWTTTQAPAPTTQAPAPTTQAPAATTQAPAATTQAPAATTQAPAATTQAPAPTTQAPAPTTQAPAPTTQAPAATTQAPAATTQAPAPTTQAPAPTTQAPAPTTQAPAPTTTQQDTQPTTAATTKSPATTTVAPVVTDATTAAPQTTTQGHTNGGTHHDLTFVSNNEFDCASRSDGYYSSPTSCSNYYVCAAHMTFRTDCHPGLFFNSQTLYCDFPDHVTCHANNGGQPANTAAPMPTTTGIHMPVTTQAPWTTRAPVVTTQAPAGSTNTADFCKGKQDGFYKDPANCSFFYQCSFETAYHEPCPAGTFFSPGLQGCDWAANVPGCP